MQIPDNPFYIVAFAPFLPAEAAGQQVRLLAIQSVDQGLAALRPSMYIPLSKALSPQGGITLEFAALADFDPAAIVARTPWMRALRDGRGAASVQGPLQAAATTLDSILDMVELSGSRAESAKRHDDGKNEADSILSGVLSRILADDDFRRLEAAWQGVGLLFEVAGADRLLLDIVPVVQETASAALESVANLLDGDPPDLILVDVPFDATPVGMLLLESAANLAERQMSPAICWCGPNFLHPDGWRALETLPYLPNHLDGFAFARWKALRARPAAFWTVAACNRFSVHPPLPGESSAGMFRSNRANYLAPVWGVASLILQAVARSGSPLGITSQVLRFTDSAGDPFMPLEAAISGDREHQLVRSGLLPLMTADAGTGIRLPEAVTTNGEPIVPLLALSTLIHTLIKLRESCGPSDDPKELTDRLREAFALHPRFKGTLPANSIDFDTAGIDANGCITLLVTLKKRLPGAKNIEFTFEW